jgi:hypothetical protein
MCPRVKQPQPWSNLASPGDGSIVPARWRSLNDKSTNQMRC